MRENSELLPPEGGSHAAPEGAKGGSHAAPEGAKGGSHAAPEGAKGGSHAAPEGAKGGSHEAPGDAKGGNREAAERGEPCPAAQYAAGQDRYTSLRDEQRRRSALLAKLRLATF